MALRGGSSLLRSLARLTNMNVAASARLSNEKNTFDYSFLNLNRHHDVAGIRMFGTSPRRNNLSAQLSEALNHEIQEEKGQAKEATSFPGFTVTTKEAEVRLTKKHGNEDILVVFNVNHSVDIDEGADDGSNAVPVPVALPPFSIEITKGDERLCFHLDLLETEEQPGTYDFQVEEFYIAPAVKGGDEDVPSHVYSTSGKYIDPTIQDLLYVQYLEERGIDHAFLQNLVAFASAYEHKLYINFLQKVKAFIAK